MKRKFVAKESAPYLSPREQQIMEIVYMRGDVTAVELMALMPDSLSNSAIRTHLRILENKGHLRHVSDTGRFVYSAVRPRQTAARFAVAQVLRTFFDNSVEKAMSTLLSVKEARCSAEELDRMQEMLERAKATNR